MFKNYCHRQQAILLAHSGRFLRLLIFSFSGVQDRRSFQRESNGIVRKQKPETSDKLGQNFTYFDRKYVIFSLFFIIKKKFRMDFSWAGRVRPIPIRLTTLTINGPAVSPQMMAMGANAPCLKHGPSAPPPANSAFLNFL